MGIFGGRKELTREAVMAALATVEDPELHRDLVSLGMVKQVTIDGGRVRVEIQLTTPACPLKAVIGREVEAALRRLPGCDEATVDFSANVAGRRESCGSSKAQGAAAGPAPREDLAPGVRNIIAVASGKGGVGKSTVSLNLALALGAAGARVGLLDADIYGPNIPTMMGLDEPPRVVDHRIQPLEKHGIKAISMGLFIPPGTPVIWRGPMLNNALRQLFGDVEWGELDYLVVDLPPGTGDVQISLVQLVPLAGAVIVTTPQAVSLEDARKGLAMFNKTRVPVLGIIENMSYFICADCGARHDIFDTGGGERIAAELGVPFLGRIPIDIAVRAGGDAGWPVTVAQPESEASRMFVQVASNLAGRLSVLNLQQEGANAPK
jgi:ATP-binding protein involved in chromosome partitioning